MNIMLALFMALGLTLSTPAPTPAPAPATTVQTMAHKAPAKAPAKAKAKAVRCEEDQPCWNCATMGNFICGPTAKGATEAWEGFSTRGFTTEELSHPFRATYRGTTARENDLPYGHEWYTETSKANPKVSHVFELEFFKH